MAKRFAVALTFAGEFRSFVEGMANSLSESLTQRSVFYDRYYEAELARPNLDLYLQNIYHNDAELIVVVVCKEYNEREWTGLEARAVRDLIKRRLDDEVMFVRVGDGEVSGIFGIDGYVDARNRPPAEIARVICDRLQFLRSKRPESGLTDDASTVGTLKSVSEALTALKQSPTGSSNFQMNSLVSPPMADAGSTAGATAREPDLRSLDLIVAIADISTRNRVAGLIEEVDRSGGLRQAGSDRTVRVKVLSRSTLDQLQHDALTLLKSSFVRNNAAAILVSDFLAEKVGEFPDETWEPTNFAKECQAEFREKILGTIAVMPSPQRVLDIDRSISPNPDADEFMTVFGLVSERLDYLGKPARTIKIPERNIDVRVIKTNQSEFLSYFELRHRIYRPMSYLSHDVENCMSGMEMDWCDKKSIHCGAFVRVGAQQKLVGTARLITDSTVSDDSEALFDELAGRDYVLRRELERALMLGLPVFESQPGTNRLISSILRNRESCGELSRVIVSPEYRGSGLSEKLIQFAVDRARKIRLQRLFLECLDIHQRLYEKMGFICVPELRGRVVGVDRTMIVMQLPVEKLSSLTVETAARKV